jgi:hypothetical protein
VGLSARYDRLSPGVPLSLRASSGVPLATPVQCDNDGRQFLAQIRNAD